MLQKRAHVFLPEGLLSMSERLSAFQGEAIDSTALACKGALACDGRIG